MYLQLVLYPSDGELLDESMQMGANLTTRRHSEREERVSSGERAPILVFLPLDCVSEVFPCIACCILQIGAGARVNGGGALYRSIRERSSQDRWRLTRARRGWSIDRCSESGRGRKAKWRAFETKFRRKASQVPRPVRPA